MIPLVCIIAQQSSLRKPRADIVQSFTRALELLQDMASDFALAELMLNRLDPAVTIAKQAIGRHGQEVSPSSFQNSAYRSQDILDLFQELSKPADEIPGQEDTLLWDDGLFSRSEERQLLVDSNNMAIFNDEMTEDFNWYGSVPFA